MAAHYELLPPASLRIRTRLTGLHCGFCGCVEAPDETGCIIPISHPKRAICELCIDYADEHAAAARLARRAPKTKRGTFRRINRHRIGA